MKENENMETKIYPKVKAKIINYLNKALVESCPYCGNPHLHYLNPARIENYIRVGECLRGSYILELKDEAS